MPTLDLPTLGKILFEAREAARLTRTSAAEKLGMTESGLWRLEKGQRKPTFDTLGRLIDVYRLDPRRLFAADWNTFADAAPSLVVAFQEIGLDTPQQVRTLRFLGEMKDRDDYYVDCLAHMRLPKTVLL